MTKPVRLLCGGALLFLAVVIGAFSSGGAPLAAAQATSSTTYKSVYDGWKWWHVYCYRCHGVDAVGTTNAPSLTDPTRKLSAAEFSKIVLNGIPDKGMQAWDKLLDRKQVSERSEEHTSELQSQSNLVC